MTAAPDMATAAQAAIEATIASGARILCDQPWRAERVIRAAETMSARDLGLACNRALPRSCDMNRTIALLQLRLATDMPEFVEAWEAWRARGGRTLEAAQ